jgi:hypothetical protein
MLILALSLITALANVPASPPEVDGYIRVVQDHGVWWFQDGAGRRFFSLGVNCIGGCVGHAEDTPIIPSRQSWIVGILREWGFNTAGAWSSPSVWRDLYVADQIYPEFDETRHDVFDESFWSGRLADDLKREVQPFLGQKNFLGYFLDNEPAWDAQRIFAFYLSLPKEAPGSRAFIAYLERFYQGSLGQLNAAWGTAYTSFEQIAGTPAPSTDSRAVRQGILNAWRAEVATTYYRRYAALVRSLDSQHLILGIRYRGVPDLELFTALSPYFDVNSINDYTRYGSLKPIYADLYKATGKPLMITEFSFSGFPQPGQKSGLFIDVYTQEHRGLGYHKYVHQAAQAPFMVGMHWFMWMDYLRREGAKDAYPYPPDENVGLVSYDETVIYEEFVGWVKRTNAEVDAIHRLASWAPPPTQEPPRLTLRRFVPTVDGDLSEWPPELGIKPTIVNALLDGVRVEHTYFLSRDEQAFYLAGDIVDAHPAPSYPDRLWQGDHFALSLAPAGSPTERADDFASIVIYPIGGGPDRQQPYAVRRDGPKRYQPIPLQIAKRLKSRGYTIEARIPASVVEGFSEVPGAAWQVTLQYQNIEAIYRAGWQGIMTLEP